MTPLTFRFRHTVFTVMAQLDADRLLTKTGVRMASAPIARLQHLYVRREIGRDEAELVLTYLTDKGRLRRLRLFADRDEPGFDALVEALLARRPEIDIRGLSASEAYRRMGSVELDWVVVPAVMTVGLLIVAVLMLPMLIHGVDGGAAETTVAALAAGERPSTRNLVVEGRALADRGVQAQRGADAKLDATTMWLPLVPTDWREGDPVPMVLEVRGLRDVDPVALGQQTRFEGVLRDVLWEGLDDAQRARLVERGVTFTPRPLLLQLGARARDDLVLALGLLSFLGLILMGTFVWLRGRRRAPPATRPPLNRGRP